MAILIGLVFHDRGPQQVGRDQINDLTDDRLIVIFVSVEEAHSFKILTPQRFELFPLFFKIRVSDSYVILSDFILL